MLIKGREEVCCGERWKGGEVNYRGNWEKEAREECEEGETAALVSWEKQKEPQKNLFELIRGNAEDEKKLQRAREEEWENPSGFVISKIIQPAQLESEFFPQCYRAKKGESQQNLLTLKQKFKISIYKELTTQEEQAPWTKGRWGH